MPVLFPYRVWYKNGMGKCHDCKKHMCATCGKSQAREGVCDECSVSAKEGAWKRARCSDCLPTPRIKIAHVREQNVALGKCRCGKSKPSGVKRCWPCVDQELQAAMRKANEKYGVADLVPWFDKQWDYEGFIPPTKARHLQISA